MSEKQRKIECPLCHEQIIVIADGETNNKVVRSHVKDDHKDLTVESKESLECYLLSRVLTVMRLIR